MTNCLRLVAVSAIFAAVPASAVPARGQQPREYGPPPLRAPAVSPYLNLLRPDAGVIPNYYSLVRPELELRSYAQSQGMALRRLQQQVRSGRSDSRQTTGHPSYFLNYSRYYPGFSRQPR